MASRPLFAVSLVSVLVTSCQEPVTDSERLARSQNEEGDPWTIWKAEPPKGEEYPVIPEDQPQVSNGDIVPDDLPIEPPRGEGGEDPKDTGDTEDPRDPWYPQDPWYPTEVKSAQAPAPNNRLDLVVIPSTDPDPTFLGSGKASRATPFETRPSSEPALNYSCGLIHRDCDGNPANGCEANVLFDPNNCAWCGRVCPTLANTQRFCFFGFCVYKCVAGFSNCDGNPVNGCEVNTQTNSSHCGSCGNACSGGKICSGGSCVTPPPPSCSPGTGDCNGNPADGCETNTNTSVNHCGACGNVCSFANAAAGCAGGICQLGACNSGFANCDGGAGNGCEVNTNTSVNNCGSCGNVCSFANASAGCTGGACQLGACNSGFANCNGSAADGCEINTNTNVNHCGSCGNVCSFANASAACSSGACQLDACNAGYGNCDGLPANGCEINTTGDDNNCGACGNVCPGGPAATCVSSVCGVNNPCDSTHLDCDGNPANGCEADILNDPEHCGGCGFSCGGGVCIGGGCF